jgi:hypothetical protein
MSEQTQETNKLIYAGLKLGIKAYESAMRLSAAGYEIPELYEFQKRAAQLRTSSRCARYGKSSLRIVGHA